VIHDVWLKRTPVDQANMRSPVTPSAALRNFQAGGSPATSMVVKARADSYSATAKLG
jgi:hypothetical protein